MSVATAEELFVDELKDIYSAEKQAVKAFPRLTKAVRSEELKQAMQEHLEQTRGQLERLDRIFEILEKRPTGKTCEGMKGLVEEAQSQVEEIDRSERTDLGYWTVSNRSQRKLQLGQLSDSGSCAAYPHSAQTKK